MSGEDVTASTLSKDQDMKEAEVPPASKKAAADVAKLERDIESAKSLAKSVRLGPRILVGSDGHNPGIC